MVVLLESIREDLPVAVVLRGEIVTLRHQFERIVVEGGDHRPEELAKCPSRLRVEVDEDEPVPDVALHGLESILRSVEAEELALLLHERQVALQVVTPSVVLAGELTAGALDLLVGIVVPHQLVSAVTADVVEGADLLVLTADHDHRRSGRVDLLGEVATDARQFLDAGDVEPGPFEDGLAFEFVELGRGRVAERDRPGSESRVVLRPSALCRLRPLPHANLPVVVGISNIHHITDPPLTPSVCPVMKPASSEHRKPTAAAMSSPVPRCPSGTLAAICSLEGRWPDACPACCIGVSMADGGMLFTVMPAGPYSRARDLVSESSAPLDAA